METMSVGELTLCFEPEERRSAEFVRDVCAKTAELLGAVWGLQVPKGCRVYIMTSWFKFAFQAASWPRRAGLVLLLPFWAIPARRMWTFAGGWTLATQKPPVVGVKPPRLIAQAADNAMGRRIFVPQPDLAVKMQHIACHELTHAFTGHLRLPAWLNEGVAMLTVDKVAGCATVLPKTLDLLSRVQPKLPPQDYHRLRNAGADAMVYLYTRGYWITRFLAEAYPEVLQTLLSRRHGAAELESTLSAALGVPSDAFWQQVDALAIAHFT